MRIISGKFKGRKLVDSSKFDLRPTTDHNREALFNILSSAKFLSEVNFDLREANILDICCGTGAVALEALSRGAKFALLVDKSAEHLEIAKKNSENLCLISEIKFLLSDVKNLRASDISYDLVYIDPPYEISPLPMVRNLIEKNFIGKNSLIVIESDKEINVENLILLERRKYGRTFFSFYKFIPQPISQ